MKNIFLLVLTLLSSIGLSFEKTKVMYALYGGISAEPKYVQMFIAGYESVGGVWAGESDTVVININSGFRNVALPLAYSNGCNLVINNFPLALNAGNITGEEYHCDVYYAKGIQSLVACGTNQFHLYSHPDRITSVISVSAGDTAGLTGYYSEFFNDHPFNLYPITSITQGTGDTATIALNVSTNGAFQLIGNEPIKFIGVSGFSNSLSGIKQNVSWVDDGQYNKFKIIFNLGSGTISSGEARMFFESYATPYTAGMLAFIRDSLECSWWEARYRMRMTATGSTQYVAFGKPDVMAAINFSGDIPADPYDVLGPVGNIEAVRRGDEVRIEIDSVGNALYYQVYDRSVLLGTYPSHGVNFFQIERDTRKHPRQFWYKAIRESQTTEESSKSIIPFYRYSKILVR